MQETFDLILLYSSGTGLWMNIVLIGNLNLILHKYLRVASWQLREALSQFKLLSE